MNTRYRLLRLLPAVGVFALCGIAAGQTPDYIYCKVSVSNAMGVLAVDLPGTATWDLGTVPQGGVADTWYDAGGKASYQVKNSGDTSADVYITAEANNNTGPYSGWGSVLSVTNALPTTDCYALAVATNVMEILPAWNILNLPLAYSMMQPSRMTQAGRCLKEATLPGEYIVFDLRFYAPTSGAGDYCFRVGFYAVPVGNDPDGEIPDPPDPF